MSLTTVVRRALSGMLTIAVGLALTSILVGQFATAGGDGSGGRAVAHYAGGERASGAAATAKAPDARLYQVGKNAVDPTMGVTKDGQMFYTAAESNTSIFVNSLTRRPRLVPSHGPCGLSSICKRVPPPSWQPGHE